MEPGLEIYVTNIVAAISIHIQKQHIHSGSLMTLKVSGRTQKVEIHKKDLVSQYLVQAYVSFLQVMLALILS